jgi:hypothetical protein
MSWFGEAAMVEQFRPSKQHKGFVSDDDASPERGALWIRRGERLALLLLAIRRAISQPWTKSLTSASRSPDTRHP